VTARTKIRGQWVGVAANRAFLFGIPILAPLFGASISFMVVGAIAWNCSGILLGKMKWPPSRSLTIYGLILFCYYGIRAISVFTGGHSDYNSFDALKSFQLLAFVPMAAALLHAQVKNSMLWVFRGASVGATIAFIVAFIQIYGFGFSRAEAGAGNPGPFSLIMVVSAGLSLLLASSNDRVDRRLAFLGWACGVGGVFLSGTKGAVPALIVSSAIAFEYLFRNRFLVFSIRKTIAACVAILIVSGLAVPVIKWRVVQLKDDFTAMSNGTFNRSTGIRLVMWQEGLKAFVAAPIFGHGYNMRSKIVENAMIERTGRTAGSHLHNSYITDLAGNGITGLLSRLLVLAVPFFLFGKRGNPPEVTQLRYVMTILISSYIIFDITSLTFGHDILDSYFVFLMAAVAAISVQQAAAYEK
jgi:O-antigen ligase